MVFTQTAAFYPEQRISPLLFHNFEVSWTHNIKGEVWPNSNTRTLRWGCGQIFECSGSIQ